MKQFLEFSVLRMVVFFVKTLPSFVTVKFGGWFFKTIGPRLKRSKVIKKNLKTCKFTENIEPVIWKNWGESVFEIFYLKKLLKNNNLELIGNIKHKKAFYVSAHLGHILVQNVALKKLGVLNLSQLYHRRKNVFMDNFFKKIHKDWANPIAKGDVKSIVNLFKSDENLIVLLDQKEDRGEKLKFFNHDAMTNVSLFKIAKKLRIPVVPIQVIKKGILKYKVIIHDEIEPDMNELNKLFEIWIKEHPDQYFWFHNRWI